MYEDEYYYEARKKENAKLDAELAGTFATVIGGLIGAVLSCLLFLLRRFDVLSSGLASLLFYMLTYTGEWHVAVYITVAFVIFIASMILQHAFLAGRIIFTIFVSIAVAIIGAGWKAYDTEIQRNTVMVICFTVTVILGLISWKRQCIFAGSTNTRQFIPFDRTGARRFLPIAIDSSKAEKHILDDEKEARSYFDQLWAEVMEIYWSTENKSSLLKFSKEMEQEISEYRKQFTQEDTMAGMIQGWLDAYKGSHVCSVQIWKEAFDHFDREPKKFETNEICSIMDTQITGWKRAGVHRFSKEGYGRQRSWIREGAEEEGGNEPDKDGFTKLTKAEQLELPFDLPDREKG